MKGVVVYKWVTAKVVARRWDKGWIYEGDTLNVRRGLGYLR